MHMSLENYDAEQAAAAIISRAFAAPVTIEDDVRAYLVACYGPIWTKCALQANLLYEDHMIYVATLAIPVRSPRGDAIAVECHVVDRDGEGWYVAPPSPVSGYIE